MRTFWGRDDYIPCHKKLCVRHKNMRLILNKERQLFIINFFACTSLLLIDEILGKMT